MGTLWAGLGGAGQASLLSDLLIGKGGGSVQSPQPQQAYQGTQLRSSKDESDEVKMPVNNQVQGNIIPGTFAPTPPDTGVRYNPNMMPEPYEPLPTGFSSVFDDEKKLPKRQGGSLW